MSSNLTQEQHEALKILEGEKSTILTTAIIRLFTFHQKEQKWLYTGLCGALCLVIDRVLDGSLLFRLYDLNAFELLFELELYYEFENLYQELNECFFCFPVIGNFVLAFSFADSNEALNMKLKINKYCPKKPKQQPDSPVLPFKKSLIKSSNFEKNEIIMGKPTNFKHLNHIGWDPLNKCFDFSHLSKEFKTVFKNAGIKKKEMRNAETALAIYETLLNQGAGTAMQSKSKTNLKTGNREAPSKSKKHSIIPEKLLRKSTNKKSIAPTDGKVRKETSLINEEHKENNVSFSHISNINSNNNEILANNGPPPPPKINLNLLGPPVPIELSKINQNNNLGLEGNASPKKTLSNKPKKSIAINPENNKNLLIEQIKAGNFKLKKVEPQTKKPENKQLTKQEEMSLTMVLAKAIAERRKNLVKDESDSEPESDWSDD